MRRRGRVDANQAALVAYARARGASWVSLANVGDGVPDGLLGYQGHTWLVEVKTATGRLTPDQSQFLMLWRGSPVRIVRTVEDIEALLLTTANDVKRGESSDAQP